MKQLTSDCINWIKNYFENTPNCNAVIGISGGKDSTVAAALCKEAIGASRVIGVLMPNGEQRDIKDSYEICNFLGINKLEVNINSVYNEITRSIFNSGLLIKNITEQTRLNLAPRIRMTILYAIAQSINGRVVNTSNLDEGLVGYCTLWGDNVGDFGPLRNLHVSEILEIGDDLEIPYSLVHKETTDEFTGKTDEQQLGFSYLSIEKIYELNAIHSTTEEQQKIMKRIKDTSWKKSIVNIPSFQK